MIPDKKAENTGLTSVVMVAYHTGPILFDAIRAVLAQTAPIELCLVDNGNPPEVVEKLYAMAQADARIRFVTGYGNVGFSRGCNTGARLATGEHLLFLNPDSILSPDAVAVMHQQIAQLAPHAMLGARLVDVEGRDQRGCRRALLSPKTAVIEALHLGPMFPKIRLNFTREPIPAQTAPMPAISGAFMFLRRDDFWMIDGFDEGYFLHVEDLDLCLRFRRAGGEIYFMPGVTVTHMGSTSAATSTFVETHKARGFVRYFHRNFSDQYPLLFLWLLDVAVWARAGVKIALSVLKKRLCGRIAK